MIYYNSYHAELKLLAFFPSVDEFFADWYQSWPQAQIVNKVDMHLNIYLKQVSTNSKKTAVKMEPKYIIRFNDLLQLLSRRPKAVSVILSVDKFLFRLLPKLTCIWTFISKKYQQIANKALKMEPKWSPGAQKWAQELQASKS